MAVRSARIIQNIYQFLTSCRDLLIPYLPSKVVKCLVGKGDFVFLAHPIDLIDLARKYPFAEKLPRKHLKVFSRNLWPVIGSKIIGYHKQDGSMMNGWVVFCPLTTRMMVLKKDIARMKILKAARFSEKLGVKWIGLGAFIPILTDHGDYLVKRVKVNVTTGNALAAVIAAKNVLKIARMAKIDPLTCKLAIVGAAGSVGAVSTRLLTHNFRRILLVDKNIKALDSLVQQVTNMCSSNELIISTSAQVGEVKDADIVLVVTNVPGAVVRDSHLKPGAIVVDAAMPKNVSTKIPRQREDVLVIESGIAEVDGLKTNFDFGLMDQSEVFSCLAEVLLLIWMGKSGNYVGKADFNHAYELSQVMESAGIKVAKFRNSLGFITRKDILRMRMKNGKMLFEQVAIGE